MVLLGYKGRALEFGATNDVIGDLGVSDAGDHRSAVHSFGTIVGVAEVLVLVVSGGFVVAVSRVVEGALGRSLHWVAHAATGL